MKTQRSLMATTHADRHGDRIAEEALEGLVEQSREHLIPVLFNHDPRVPPVGRMIGAEIQSLPDREFAIVATSEIFEPGDDDAPSDDSREMRIREFESTGFTVVYDRSYGSDTDQAVLEQLSEAPGVHVRRADKKALEPISILLLAVGAGAAAFLSGFFSGAGADTWDLLKNRISKLLANRRNQTSDFLFLFELRLERSEGVLAIQCILSNPEAEGLEDFWRRGLPLLQEYIPYLELLPPDIRCVVLSYAEGTLSPGFAIRRDCRPIRLSLPPKP